jgi:hypothetical protein
MRVERSISTGPRRSTEQTCVDIAKFVTDVLGAREYPRAADAPAAFEKLFPLLRLLLSTRALGEPALTVTVPDLEVGIAVHYDVESEENLTLPNLVLLDPLTAADVVIIGVNATSDVVGKLGDLPAAASTKSIRFELNQGAGGGPEPAPAADTDVWPADAAAEGDDDGAAVPPLPGGASEDEPGPVPPGPVPPGPDAALDEAPALPGRRSE